MNIPAAANLVGALGKFLGLASLFPVAVAIGYGEQFWPFLAAGVIVSGSGYALERLTATADGPRSRCTSPPPSAMPSPMPTNVSTCCTANARPRCAAG